DDAVDGAGQLHHRREAKELVQPLVSLFQVWPPERERDLDHGLEHVPGGRDEGVDVGDVHVRSGSGSRAPGLGTRNPMHYAAALSFSIVPLTFSVSVSGVKGLMT